MQVVRKSDIKTIRSEQRLVFMRADDVASNAWNNRYVCACAAE